jgi:hypothetical protein
VGTVAAAPWTWWAWTVTGECPVTEPSLGSGHSGPLTTRFRGFHALAAEEVGLRRGGASGRRR